MRISILLAALLTFLTLVQVVAAQPAADDDAMLRAVYERHGMRPVKVRRRVADVIPMETLLRRAMHDVLPGAATDEDRAVIEASVRERGELIVLLQWFLNRMDAGGSSVEELRMVAAFAYWCGEAEALERAVTALRDRDPDDADARLREGHLFMLRHEVEAAADSYASVTDSRPVLALYNGAMVQRGRGALEESLAMLTSAESQVGDGDGARLRPRLAEERGSVLRELGRLDAAMAAFNSAEQGYAATDDERGVAECVLHRARVHRDRGDAEQCAKHLSTARAQFERLGAQRRVAWVLHDQALLRAQQGDVAEARTMIERARTISDARWDTEATIAQLSSLAMLDLQRGRWDLAERTFGQSARRARAIHWTEGEALAIDGQARVLAARGDDDDAAARFRRAVDLENSIGRTHQAAFSAVGLAQVESSRGRHDAALRIVSDAIEVFTARGLAHDLASATLALADIHMRRGEPAPAMEAFRDATSRFAAIDDQPGRASALAGLGNLLLRRGDLDEARAVLNESLAIDRALERPIAMMMTLDDLAEVGWLSEDFEFEEACEVEAWRLAQQLGEERPIGHRALSMGVMKHRRGAFEEAIEMYEQARIILEPLGPTTELAALYGDMGLVLHLQRAYDDAEVMFHSGLRVADELRSLQHQAFLQRCLGDLRRSQRRFEESRDALMAALKAHTTLEDVQGMFEDCRSLAWANSALDAHEEAEAQMTAALGHAERLGRVRWQLEALIGLGDVVERAGDRERARGYWIRARDLAFEIRAERTIDRIQERLGRR